jgi:hypothetical protein
MRWLSRSVPKATVTKAWVSPRVKTAEPWARGRPRRPRSRSRGSCPRRGRRCARGGRADERHQARVVLAVGRQDGRDDLDLVVETVGEERPNRAVDDAAGEDGVL